MPAPEQLGKYQIRRELGRGAMGVVYEGYDPLIERSVAIKVLRTDEANAAHATEFALRFRREAQAAGRLSHPNIVSVYEFGEAAGGQGAFIAMELVQGRELKSLFDLGRRFSLPDIGRIMGELLAALQHAHERGVVHRDVKPGNIILQGNGSVKVADFGIAKLDSSDLTQLGSVLGTVSHMSPEQLNGQPVDRRSDLFSCGVILYQLLTGQRPFTGSAATLMHSLLNLEPAAPSSRVAGLSRAMDAVVRKAMAKQPAQRYATADEFAAALRAALAGQPDADDTVLRPLAPGAGANAGPSAESKLLPSAASGGRPSAVSSITPSAGSGVEPSQRPGVGPTERSDVGPTLQSGAWRGAVGIGIAAAALLSAAGYGGWAWFTQGGAGESPQPVHAALPLPTAPSSVPSAAVAAAPAMAALPQPVQAAPPQRTQAALPPPTAPGSVPSAAVAAAPAIVDVARPTRPRQSAEEIEQLAWDDALKANSGAAYQAYLTGYPNGRFAGRARIRLAAFAPKAVPAAAPPTAAAPAPATPTAAAPTPERPAAAVQTKPALALRDLASAKASTPALSPSPSPAPRSAPSEHARRAPALPPPPVETRVDTRVEATVEARSAAGNFPAAEPEPRREPAGDASCASLASRGTARCQVTLGHQHRIGKGVPRDGVEALRWYRLAAEQGDAEGQYEMAAMLASGQGGRKDDFEAVRWLRKAADQGYLRAQNRLGLAYENGTGMPVNLVLAADWYRKAADRGLTPAQTNLGRLYLHGRGVFKDSAKAAELLQRAAAQGEANAKFHLGWMYQTGEGQPRDKQQAARLYREALAGASLAERNRELASAFLAAPP